MISLMIFEIFGEYFEILWVGIWVVDEQLFWVVCGVVS